MLTKWLNQIEVKHFLEKTLTLPKKPPDLNAYKMRIVRWCNGSTKDSGSFCWGSSPYRTTIKTLAKARVFCCTRDENPMGSITKVAEQAFGRSFAEQRAERSECRDYADWRSQPSSEFNPYLFTASFTMLTASLKISKFTFLISSSLYVISESLIILFILTISYDFIY